MTTTAVVQDREAWLAERRTYIGANDLSAILGLNPYRTALQVWEDKKGLALPQPETAAMRRGTRMEPYVAGLYAEETGADLVKSVTFRHPLKPWLGVNPDYLAIQEPVESWLVELKTHNPFTADGYGEPGTDQIPAHEVIQCVWQLHLTGYKRCDLAVLFGLDDFRIYTIPYDAEFGASLEDAADRFQADYILAECPPPISGADADTEWLKQRFPKDAGITIRATPEIKETCLSLAEARKVFSIAEADKKRIENEIKVYMCEAAVLEWSGGKPFTWRTAKPSDVTDWKAVATALGAPAALIAANTIKKPGSRRFLTPFTRED